MKRDFNKWLETFRSSICDYKFYVDFEKVYGKVDNIKVELNIFNSLIGSKNIENGKTRTFIKLLTDEERVREIARIIGGAVSNFSLEHAKLMLDNGKKFSS